MLLSVELTLYPLQDNYLDIIKSVVEKLNAYEQLSVQTFPTATVLVGEFDEVTQAVNDTIKWSYKEFGRAVFIAKFLPDYQAL